jgi:hypothetical protein
LPLALDLDLDLDLALDLALDLDLALLKKNFQKIFFLACFLLRNIV